MPDSVRSISGSAYGAVRMHWCLPNAAIWNMDLYERTRSVYPIYIKHTSHLQNLFKDHIISNSYFPYRKLFQNHILLIMSKNTKNFAVTTSWFLPTENYSNCLAAFTFLVISRFCCLWWLIYMPFGNSKSRKQGNHHFWKGLCARRYLCLVFQRH